MCGLLSAARSSAEAGSSAEMLQQAVLHQAALCVSHIRLSTEQALLDQFVLHMCCIRLSVELHRGLCGSSGW